MDRSNDTTAHQTADRIARLAWLCAFILPLILATALLGVKSTQAAPHGPTAVPFAFEDLEEEELDLEEEESIEEESEAEFAEAECEIAEEEAEEGEITQAEANALCKEVQDFADAGRSSAAEKCPIRSARAHVSVRRNRLKLTIGYTTSSPVSAAIQIRKLGTFKRHLGKSGVLRFTRRINRKLSKRQLKIRFRLSSGSAGCPSRRLVLFPR
ncbi:MAG TPA: hypothetical protein VFT19_00065 [Solirubrobacterales bacterium]|nr:hypothetical protein [Solirubrobacterales bacterium]